MTKQARLYALGASLVGALGCLVGFFVDREQLAWSYLVAWISCLTIALGALGFTMMANVTRARWFVAIRRILEALSLTLPLLAALFVPVALFARRLYPWARPSSTWDPIMAEKIAAKRAYLSFTPWCIRAIAFLAVWSALALLLRRWSLKNDVAALKIASGATLPLLGLTVTFAAFDWMMSTDPTWASNMYGVYVFAASTLAGISASAVLAHAARARGLLPKQVGAPHFHALGNLMLAAVLFWSYIAFEQLLIIWMADLPDEVTFYATRVRGGWAWVTWFLGLGHFAIPFLVLLQRSVKRSPARLAVLGIGLLVVHVVDMHWLLAPNLHPLGWSPHWLDLAALMFVGGATCALTITAFHASSTVPEADPALGEGLAFEMP